MKIVVTFHDGTTEEVEGTDLNIYQGVLSIHRRTGIQASHMEHVGSYPLVSIRKWKQED